MTKTLQLAVVFALATVCARGEEARTEASLKSAAAPYFEIGVGISDRIAVRPDNWPLLLHHYSTVTPENCLKPNPVQVEEGRFQFELADEFVSFASSNRLRIVGHCLVWAKDDRTPPWFFRDGTNDVSDKVLLERMKRHIQTVAGRYRGRIAMWDVVNEALDDSTNFLRPSGWTRACGEEFMIKAFEYARAADPEAILIYNDYNTELPGKRDKLIQLIKLMKQRNAPLQAIGLQGHYVLGQVPFKDLEETLKVVKDSGLKVVISELDIDVIPHGRWWADNGKHREEIAKHNPYPTECPPQILKQQADEYAQLFRLFKKYSAVIERVSFWNLHDGESWLNYFPWRRQNHPLLFDRARHPKPAFDAVITELRQEAGKPVPDQETEPRP